MAGIPSGATLTVLSDGNTPNTGKFIAVMSGTYTAADFTLDPISYPVASKIGMGIKPNHVRITNLTDRISMEATYGSTSGLLTVAAGTRTYVTHGLTFTDRSLTVAVATNSIVGSNDTILFEIQKLTMALIKKEETGGEALEMVKEIGQTELLDPSAQIDPVQMDLENATAKSYMDELAWLAEKRPVTILESSDEADMTNIVELRLNGKLYVFRRGEEKAVPRFVIEHIAKSKSDRWSFSAAADPSRPDGVRTTNRNAPVFRYPHMFAPSGAKESAWYQKAKLSHF